jgi:hypothetical protein
MTVKRGDTIFVTQAHAAQEVIAIVASVQYPQVRAHVVSSTDPYHLETFEHRLYADDVGYLEVDEQQPTELRPKPQGTAYADAPQEFSSGESETPNAEGDGSGLVHEEPYSAAEEEPASEDQQEEDPPEDEEVADEPEEGEGSAAVPEDEPNRQPVRASRRKGSRK